jgi:hypothetical protein
MLHIPFEKRPKRKTHQIVDDFIHFDLRGKTIEDKVKLLILRDLMNVNWDIKYSKNKIIVSPPEEYTKTAVKEAMAMKRVEILHNNRRWIKDHMNLAKENLAPGIEVIDSKIKPVIEVCETKKQHDLFRIFRYSWSSPYSEYVGRRIKIIIRDHGIKSKPVIGIAALGSPIIHIPERDEWIGWDKEIRTKYLNFTMDAYVIGALPPYNDLLGGKLISYILASKKIRDIYSKKYKNQITLIDKKIADKLVGIFTTSLYGKSSQYNRITYDDKVLYMPIGQTKGFGTLHFSEQTIKSMVTLLKSRNISARHDFGSGPSWVMRVVRSAGEILGFDSDYLLKHSFKREIYFVPLTTNYKEFLNGKTKKVKYTNFKMKDLVEFWKSRWFEKRKLNPDVLLRVLEFNPENFEINI